MFTRLAEAGQGADQGSERQQRRHRQQQDRPVRQVEGGPRLVRELRLVEAEAHLLVGEDGLVEELPLRQLAGGKGPFQGLAGGGGKLCQLLILIVEPAVYEDERGYFLESWNEIVLEKAGLEARFVQDNHSRSGRGILRGLHYQLNQPQGKLIRVVTGEVFDVAVDIRKGSPRFGQWAGVTLSEENRLQLYIPPGFAHGFCTLSEQADFLYKCTDFYSPDDDRTLRWDDPVPFEAGRDEKAGGTWMGANAHGLVVGLNGTGDRTTQAKFTIQTLRNMLEQLGITVPPGTNLQLNNIAAVAVHAELPPFAKPGQRIDVGCFARMSGR